MNKETLNENTSNIDEDFSFERSVSKFLIIWLNVFNQLTDISI